METDILDYYSLSEVLEMFDISEHEVLDILVKKGLIEEEDVLRRFIPEEQETEETDE